MKKVKIVKITPDEIKDLKKGYNAQVEASTKGGPRVEVSYEELLEDNTNQTLSVLRQIKNVYEWKDIEKMVEYVAMMKKFDKKCAAVELDNDQYKIAVEVFQGAVKSGKINGFGAEKLVQVYSEFKNAQ